MFFTETSTSLELRFGVAVPGLSERFFRKVEKEEILFLVDVLFEKKDVLLSEKDVLLSRRSSIHQRLSQVLCIKHFYV